MDTNRRFPLVLSGFWLKIIAIVTMTIDHAGFFMGSDTPLAIAFRFIGRISLPLFCFLIAEGVIHTKSFKKYALRLGIVASVISIPIILDETFNVSGGILRMEGNIFIDLLLGALAVYCLNHKKWYIKLLSALPILFSVYTFIGACLEACGCHGDILWCPYFIRGEYHWFSVMLIVGFYLAHFLKNFFIKYHSGLTGIDVENYKDTNIERNSLNIFSLVILVAVTVGFYVCSMLMPAENVYWVIDVQLMSMVSGVFILLYNGQRGYNKKWFQYGSYIYYPLHLIVIYAIYALVFMI